MGKGSKVLGVLLIVLAIGCFGLYFIYGSKPSEYKVVFDSDGGTAVVEQIVKKGEKAVKPENPIKDKNDFIEWQLNGVAYNFDSSVESNLTLKALWQAYNTYNVKVTLEDKEYTADMREGEPINLDSLSMPLKDGYRIKLFDEEDKEYNIKLTLTKDLVLTGKYVEIQMFTVKFDSDGGTKVDDIKIEDGATITEPRTIKEGFVFDAWYLNDEKFEFTTPITKDITLKAKWNDGSKFTVTFKADDKVYKTVTVSENTKVAKPSNPTKSGYTFVEWKLNDKAFDFETKITENITLIAEFEKASSYIVKFDSDGGSTVKQQEVTAGGKATKPSNPTKTGYTFVEWQLNNKAYNFNNSVDSDITLKAKWEKVKKTYTITFDKNNGDAVEKKTVTEGEKVTRPSDPSKTGYAFDEWLYDNKTFDFNTPITKDMTITARYRLLKSFTVTFNSNGGSSVSSQVITEGGKATRPNPDPTKDNATFKEWQLNGQKYDFTKPVTANIELTAVWDPVNPDVSGE